MKEANWERDKGRMAIDRVTGFKGVVTSMFTCLTGCDQYCLQPQCKEGEHQTFSKCSWMDVTKLDMVPDSVAIEIDEGANGCDITPPNGTH